jgi:2,3-bisphosphoglycerate-dependent phosphoglycerate mutase
VAMITTLLLTRHGEAHCNVAGVAGGEKACTGLTDHGRHQVRLLAERLCAEEPPDVLYASPRRRTIESADILSAVLGVKAITEPDLSGPDHGLGDGQHWDQIKADFGGPPQSDPDRPYAPGSETWNQYLTRAGAALARLTERHHGQRILIAGHGETIEAAATLFLQLPPGSCTRIGFQSHHAAITSWQLQRNRLGQQVWLLRTHNDTRHLASMP